ncbi:septum formation family protein [Nonomuraea sp. NPDC050783]|uniref:septum formation family protein n=1 Tax=Nonomuraea sp. NPDC050783 TaxID=3154634 RepID=UPI0034668229
MPEGDPPPRRQGRLRAWGRVVTTQPLAVQLVGGVAAALVTGLVLWAAPAIGSAFAADATPVLLVAGPLMTVAGAGFLLARVRRGRLDVPAVALGTACAVIGAGLGGAGLRGWVMERSSASPRGVPSVPPPAAGRVGLVVLPYGLQVGDCLLAPDVYTKDTDALPDSNDPVRIVSCRSRHDLEVVWAGNLWAADDPFPGSEKIDDLAVRRCRQEFESYVGIAYDLVLLEIARWMPNAGTWSNGDRSVVCAAHHPRTPMDYSIRNLAGR